ALCSQPTMLEHVADAEERISKGMHEVKTHIHAGAGHLYAAAAVVVGPAQGERRIVADADDVAVPDRKQVDYARHARARYMTHDAVDRSARLEPPPEALNRLCPLARRAHT